MNERIAEHALDAIVKYPAAEAWVFTDEELVRFARLIVEDCAFIADRNWAMGAPTGSIMRQYFEVDAPIGTSKPEMKVYAHYDDAGMRTTDPDKIQSTLLVRK